MTILSGSKGVVREMYSIFELYNRWAALIAFVVLFLSIVGITVVTATIPDQLIPTQTVEFTTEADQQTLIRQVHLPRYVVGLVLGLVLLSLWIFVAAVRLQKKEEDQVDRRLDELSRFLRQGNEFTRRDFIRRNDPDAQSKFKEWENEVNAWYQAVQEILETEPYTETDLIRFTEPPPRTGLQTMPSEAHNEYWSILSAIEDHLISLRGIIDQYN